MRLRNVETRAEMDVERREVAEVVLRAGTSNASAAVLRAVGGSNTPTSKGGAGGVIQEDLAPASPLSSGAIHSLSHLVFPNVDVIVLHDETRGRANRKIQIQAQQDMSKVLRV